MEPPTIRERLADLWDSMQALWAQRVLGYDRAAQRDFFRGVMRTLDDVGRAFQGRGGERRRLLFTLAWSLGATLLLVAVILFLRLRRMARREEGDISADAKRARKVYRALVRSLRGAGVRREPHHSTDDLLEAVRGLFPEGESALVSRAESLVERYDASRFGGEPLPAEEARELIQEARRVGQEIETACR